MKNLSVEGYVYGRRMVGGIVGRVGNTAYGVRVENCANKANIFNTDSKGIGGVVGSGWGKGSIFNCYNTGNVTTTYTSPAGGICGSNRGMDIYSCYSIGTINTGEAKTGRGIGGHDGSTYEVDNCYYLEGSDDDKRSKGYYKGGATNLSIRVKALTGEQLREKSTLDNLNANGESFHKDTENINGGYPILFFEKGGPAEERLYTVSLTQSDGGRVNASQEGKVPYGTVIRLSNQPMGGYILNCYKADGKEMVGRYYTVTSDVTLSADFIKLKKGKLTIGESKDCVVSLTKRGTVLDEEGNGSWVVNRQVSHGDPVFEKDTLSARAVLDQYAAPEDANKEYSGDFTFRYTYRKDGQSDYNVTANRGVHTLTDRIEGAELIVTATPMTKPKTWETQGDIRWYQNNEDAESYTINTAEELAGLLYLVNEKSVTFEGKTILLGRNISLNNTDGSGGNRLWPGIGKNQQQAFKGVFDGQGNTISDMKAIVGGSNSGLFRYTKGGEIRNLTLRGESRSAGGTGGLIGRCDGTKVENCINYTDVYDRGQYAGGIAGQTTGGAQITKCINRGAILGANGVGGIVGGNTGKADVIADCVNYGTVEATDTRDGCGGIAGRNNGSILRCGNYGDISSAGWYLGGVVGHNSGSGEGGAIKSCYNKGDIYGKLNTSDASIGGIVGYGQYIKLENAFNTGKITVEGREGSAHVGGVCGRILRKLNNSITMSYYLDTSCPYGIDGSNTNLGLSYVDILSKTEEEMKEEAFAALLNGNAQGLDFQSGNNDYPFLSWLNEKGAYLVTFQGDYTGSILVYEGGVAPLPQPAAGKTYAFTANGDSWSGENITSNVTVDVTEGDATYYATFMADGQQVAKVPFVYGATSVTEPQLPVKPGCRGRWPAYTLGAGDVTIHGVYVRDAVQGGVHLDTDGYYYIGASSTGTITVDPGAQVTLDGEKRLCNNLNIHVKSGGILHMRDVYLSDENTVLTLEEGSTVVLEGENTLQGAAMEAGNEPENINLSPTISVKGNVTVEGDGTLYATAEAGNSCINLADGATLEQKGGVLKIYKNTKLGIAGGAVHGPNGTIKVSGGTFFPVAASDNLRAVNVKSLQVKGGEALVYTMDESIALAAQEIEVCGGLLKVVAREHDTHEYAYDGDAIDCPAFKEKYRLYSPDISDMARPYRVMVDGQPFYDGHGVMMDFSEKGGFISASDHKTYIWISKLAHTISIGGKTVDLGAEGE